MFFSLSSYPCCSVIFFSPLARLLWFSLGFSPLAPWLWLRLCFTLTTCFLALQSHFCGRLHLPGCLACTPNTTARQCARDRWLAVGARARWSCSLQQRVLLTMRTDLSFWSSGRFVAAAVRRWFPTPLRHHCVIPRAVSILITKACIPASCHGVVRRFVRHRWRVIDPRVSLSSGFFVSSCHCHTLLPFTCAHDSLSLSLLSSSPASQCLSLRSAAIARLVLDASLLHYTRAARPTLLISAVQSFCWMRNSVFPFLLAC